MKLSEWKQPFSLKINARGLNSYFCSSAFLFFLQTALRLIYTYSTTVILCLRRIHQCQYQYTINNKLWSIHDMLGECSLACEVICVTIKNLRLFFNDWWATCYQSLILFVMQANVLIILWYFYPFCGCSFLFCVSIQQLSSHQLIAATVIHICNRYVPMLTWYKEKKFSIPFFFNCVWPFNKS